MNPPVERPDIREERGDLPVQKALHMPLSCCLKILTHLTIMAEFALRCSQLLQYMMSACANSSVQSLLKQGVRFAAVAQRIAAVAQHTEMTLACRILQLA